MIRLLLTTQQATELENALALLSLLDQPTIKGVPVKLATKSVLEVRSNLHGLLEAKRQREEFELDSWLKDE